MTSNALKNRGEEEIGRLRSKLPVLKSSFGVRKIGIFGSVARGEDKPSSDIDVLVEFEDNKATFRNFMGLISFLEEIFGRKVDLVTTNGIDKYLRPHIEKEVIWC
jgi:predicted nucleotidyltransferase